MSKNKKSEKYVSKTAIVVVFVVCAILAIGAGAAFALLQNRGNSEVVEDDELPYTIPTRDHGIDDYMFESTSDREFSFVLTNIKENETFNLTRGITPKKMKHLFSSDSGNDSMSASLTVSPAKTQLWVESSVDTGLTLTVAVVNDALIDRKYDDCRIFYVSFESPSGKQDWELCGVKVGMTLDEIKAVLGDPTDVYEAALGTFAEYYVLQDGHAYILSILFKDDGSATKVSLNIDNYPLYN